MFYYPRILSKESLCIYPTIHVYLSKDPCFIYLGSVKPHHLGRSFEKSGLLSTDYAPENVRRDTII
jgi:hypothetical protein